MSEWGSERAIGRVATICLALLLRASASVASAASAASAAAYFAKVSHAVRPPSPPALSVVLFACLHLLFTFAFSSMSFLFDFWSLPAENSATLASASTAASSLCFYLIFYVLFFLLKFFPSLFLFCVFLTAGSTVGSCGNRFHVSLSEISV